eukprot:scaffold89527_cov63-Phaeocystis_antarctica.AAC.2
MPPRRCALHRCVCRAHRHTNPRGGERGGAHCRGGVRLRGERPSTAAAHVPRPCHLRRGRRKGAPLLPRAA